ncbi:EbsA family protein [Loigolactobacillus bifermentans]|uniref:Pore-forming protein n=1 Tax=Loigolactobacillus bifermentans DSM 20003 TaxID=1423726 RepID=A0A0R1GJW1_9LACO|nr:EbsA family protein [Loigolactobacillus bifermentans]KRK34304.1 hypothetical protein FC07_GL000870 [Loigolactobacillus bifermentans DSM 20003]QGG59412.1 hypothetical protein LB003_02410 [Loigolactobacillus bifermentans]
MITIKKQQQFFYQPDSYTSIITWSWLFVILLMGVVVWLEFTHFQWISGVLFLIAVILAGINLLRRRVQLTTTAIIFKGVRPRQQRALTFDQLAAVYTKPHQLNFQLTTGESFQILIRTRAQLQLVHGLNTQKIKITGMLH